MRRISWTTPFVLSNSYGDKRDDLSVPAVSFSLVTVETKKKKPNVSEWVEKKMLWVAPERPTKIPYRNAPEAGHSLCVAQF